MHMPQIENLHINATSSEDLRFALCGHAAMSHFDDVGEKLAASVNRYAPPLSCHRLPSLSIGSTGAAVTQVDPPHPGQGEKLLKYSIKLPEGWY